MLTHLNFFTLSHTQPLHNSHLNTGYLIAEIQANLSWNKVNTWLNKFNLTHTHTHTQNQMQNTTKINLTTSKKKKYKPSKPLDQNTKTTTTHSPTQNHCYPPLSQIKCERRERSKPNTRSKPTKSTNPPPSITTQNQPNTTCQNHH